MSYFYRQDRAQDREFAANRSPSPTLREDKECFAIYLSLCVNLMAEIILIRGFGDHWILHMGKNCLHCIHQAKLTFWFLLLEGSLQEILRKNHHHSVL
jgi:hypothetical protein